MVSKTHSIRRFLLVMIYVLLCAFSQAQSKDDKERYSGGTIACFPALVQAQIASLSPAVYTTEASRAHFSGSVTVDVIIDAHGTPVRPTVKTPVGMGLDESAIEAVLKSKFEAAHIKSTGKPVPTLISIDIPFQPNKAPNTEGADRSALKIERIGGDISAPVLIAQDDLQFGEEVNKVKLQGPIEVQLTVDAQGMPQNVKLVHPLGSGLDEKALEVTKSYRFKPAHRKDGSPVAVMITAELHYHFYRSVRTAAQDALVVLPANEP